MKFLAVHPLVSFLPVLLLAAGGCKREEQAAKSSGGSAAGQVSIAALAGAPDRDPLAGLRKTFDVVEGLSRCEIRHRGVLFDLGAPSVEGLEGWRLTPNTNVTSVEREGATWAKVQSRQLTYRFVLEEPQSVFLSAKLRGVASKSAALSIDGKSVGSLNFARNQTRQLSTPILGTPLSAGPHTIGLRFIGGSKEGTDTYAEVDWLRVGIPDDDNSSFAAPTQNDVVLERMALQKLPHRSIALRAPGVVRCTVGISPGARLRTAVGLLGNGEGEADIRLVQDGQPGELLKSIRVLGGENATWQDLDLPLSSHEGEVATLELSSTTSTRGARVVFGDPVIVTAASPEKPTPLAKAVIIVVVSSLNPERLPPWAPDKPLPTFDTLAREGVVFEHHRSPSTVPAAVMASLLTGLAPRKHSLEDAYARLPTELPMLASVSRDASIRTAFFTANPTTFEAFGFSRGWDRFEEHSPISPALGIRPIEDLIAWLNEHGTNADKGLLAVAHTRGIHPPYDVSPGEFAQMPPENYAGPLDARRTGQTLEQLRVRKKNAKQRWTDADTARLSALMDASMAQTDRSLSNLIDTLRKTRLWDQTLLVVTSDVASAVGAIEQNNLPFAENLDLTEDALRVPLYVHFPGGVEAGKRVESPTTTVDVTRTALRALGIEMPGAGGKDLFALTQHDSNAVERPLMATLPDRYAVRWGDYRLSGRESSAPSLCDLHDDPKCEKNLAEQQPTLTSSMFRFAYDQEQLARKGLYVRPRREPATIDPDLAAALAVWGR